MLPSSSIIANKRVNVYRPNVTEQLESTFFLYLSQFGISIEFGFIQVFRFRFGFPWETWTPIVKRRESRGDFRPHARDISSAKKITLVFSEAAAGAAEFPDRIGAVASDRVTAWLDSRVNLRCHANRFRRRCSTSRRIRASSP